jgi:hypothetical protein
MFHLLISVPRRKGGCCYERHPDHLTLWKDSFLLEMAGEIPQADHHRRKWFCECTHREREDARTLPTLYGTFLDIFALSGYGPDCSQVVNLCGASLYFLTIYRLRLPVPALW